MSDHEEELNHDFASADAGSSVTYPQQCSALRKNGFVMLKSRPCKIVEMSTSKTGKHGHAKVHMVGIDIFNNKKYEDICPSTHNMNVPHVKRVDYQLSFIADDGFLTLMTDTGELKEDLQCKDETLLKEITAKFEADEQILVTVLSACGEEAAIATKAMTK
jgi:translation initiation factor 5A